MQHSISNKDSDKHKAGRIMIVDDNPDNLHTLKAMLEVHGYKTFAAINGELALQALNEVQPELFLLDIQMPNMDGYEVCQRLKAEPASRDIPVLFISALHDPMDKVKGFDVGGVDYISKPFQSEEVLARVKTHLNLYHLQQDLESRVNARTLKLIDTNKALRKAEEETAQQRERLARLARIQVAGEMATSFAHEVNQPLAAIESYAQAGLHRLETDADNIEKLKELLDKIRNQANRAGHVIENLRAMVKKHETINVMVDVNDLLNETVGLAEIEIASCGCQVKIISAHDLPEIEVDKIQIQQVILNLIRNAVDAVCDFKEEEKKQLVVQSSMNEKKEVEFSVVDNGNGVLDSGIENLFNPFFTTKETGMGIGLSICRTIIEGHGGKIWYSSNPVGGAIFHFSLPVKSTKV